MFPESDSTGKPLLLHHLIECKAKTVICQGGRRCFAPNTVILVKGTPEMTNRIEIKDILPGDKVCTFNEKTKRREYKSVTDVHIMANTQRTVRIKLKNGKSITCTEDHEFYFNGRWVAIKKILSLLDGNMENNSRI